MTNTPRASSETPPATPRRNAALRRQILLTWIGAATGCLAARSPAAAAAPGGPGGAPGPLAALLAIRARERLTGLAAAGAVRHAGRRDSAGERKVETVRYALTALCAGAALLPLSAGTALISTAGALLLTGTTLSTGNDASLRGTAAGAAALAHFLATMPGVTADHLRYGLEAPTLLGDPAAWDLRPPWSADSQAAGRTASWASWWTTMKQAAAEGATTDIILSPASLFAAAAGAAGAARRPGGADRQTRTALWTWLTAGAGAAALGLASGWTGIGGRASGWLQGLAGAALAMAAEPDAHANTGSNEPPENAQLPVRCAAAAALATHANPLCSPTPLGLSTTTPTTRLLTAAVTGAVAALVTTLVAKRERSRDPQTD